MSNPNTQFAVAVHSLTLIAALPEELLTSATIAASTGSNPVHVRRVLGQLRETGLVASRPGPRGGWRLLRPAEQISLGEIWEATNGSEPILGLHQANPDCEQGRQIQLRLEHLDRLALAAVVSELETRTLADLAAGTLSTPAGRAK